ncbi:MAG: aminodeoxychorismate synthase component I [Candidatus Omnitrophica bacterium]|nr:aminodeoxychorismate synthase component I [Candidatus Omnitrophota bacterium]
MAYYILKSYKLKCKPHELLRIFSERSRCFFLDSSLNANALGRYSFLGFEPFYVLSASGKEPFQELRETLAAYKLSLAKCDIPFLGGAVGYLAYDLGLVLEKKTGGLSKQGLNIPDYLFGFYNTVVIIDNLKSILHIFASGFPEKRSQAAKALCEENFKKTRALLTECGSNRSAVVKRRGNTLSPEIKSNFKKGEYLAAVLKAKEYIKKGDIYQVNLSQRLETKTDLSAVQIYERLRHMSPADFGCYFDGREFQILSSSPERFLKVEGDLVTTRPMKGTRPRCADKKEDRKLKNALLESSKDKAELMMIVDLLRNDLGRVCDYGSIKVETLRQLETYKTVFQTTATVTGRLHKTKDSIDLLRACFPGGSITGCPKIRSMEIIDELEPVRRSVYTGALGYVSFSGNMDFNILIRTILKKEDALYFGAGGGIVADSVPEEEYKETLVKAQAMIQALK